MMTRTELEKTIQESLRDWFKKEKWVRISSSGNIAGPCGTSKNKKNPDRCLPKAKAQSLTKSQRAATAQKKKKAGKKGKTVVKNTKKATVKKEGFKDFLKKSLFSKDAQARMREKDLQKRINDTQKEYYRGRSQQDGMYMAALHMITVFGQEKDKQGVEYAQAHVDNQRKKYGSRIERLDSEVEYTLANLKETKEAPAGHYFTKSGNLVKGRMTKAAKERGARQSDPKDKQRSKVPPVTQTREDIRNLVVGTIHEMKNENTIMEKDDRCTRLAKQKYDTWPSAYASGAVVRCRRGEIWKKK